MPTIFVRRIQTRLFGPRWSGTCVSAHLRLQSCDAAHHICIGERCRITIRAGRRTCFHFIMGALRSLRVYSVYWDVLNAEDFGVPQHRPRVFIVCILKGCDCGFPCPCLRLRVSLEHYLLPRRQRPSWEDLPATQTAKRNVLECLQRFDAGHHPFHEPLVLNAGAAPRRCHTMFDMSPCLTRSRALDHWLCNRGRFMHISEMMKLQGFPASYRWEGSPVAFGAMLGNSMCVSVLEALFACVLRSSGLLGW